MRWLSPYSIPVTDPLRILVILTSCRFLDSSSQNGESPGRNPVDGESKVDSYLKKDPRENEDKNTALSQRLQFHEFIPAVKGASAASRRSHSDPYWYGGEAGSYNMDILPPELPFTPVCSDPTVSCRNLSAHCLDCDIGQRDTPYEHNCTYGDLVDYHCEVRKVGLESRTIHCKGRTEFDFKAKCRFCYQTEPREHACMAPAACRSNADPSRRMRMNCSVTHDVICLGRRTFYKMDTCDFSSGYRWSVAMLLSVTGGGFGADRFYLGHWQEGIGKLFSFGGLGVWTIVDIVLIAIGYLRPRDGSLYMDYDG